LNRASESSWLAPPTKVPSAGADRANIPATLSATGCSFLRRELQEHNPNIAIDWVQDAVCGRDFSKRMFTMFIELINIHFPAANLHHFFIDFLLKP
jgi:hypothetical protein